MLSQDLPPIKQTSQLPYAARAESPAAGAGAHASLLPAAKPSGLQKARKKHFLLKFLIISISSELFDGKH